MYVMGSISFWFLGSAEVQHWSKFEVNDLHRDLDIVESNKTCGVDNGTHKSSQ